MKREKTRIAVLSLKIFYIKNMFMNRLLLQKLKESITIIGFLILFFALIPSANAIDSVEIFLQLGHSGDVSSVSFSPDGHRIASGSRDETVKIWEADTGKLVRTLKGHSDVVSSVSFSPDGHRIVSGSRDKTVNIWEADTGKLVRTLKGHSSLVNSVSFSPDGQWIASGSWDKTVNIWEADTGKLVLTLKGHSISITSVNFSPDSHRIASGSQDNTVKIWEAGTGKLIRTLIGHSGSIYSVSFSPDGQWIASGSWDKTVNIWEADTGKLVLTLKGHSGSITSVNFSPDSHRIASGSWDNTVKVWEANTGKLIRTLTGHSGNVYSVSFSPDSQWIASGSQDNTVKIWEAGTDKLIRTLTGHSGSINSVSFTPDGQWIASGNGDNTIKLWKASTGELMRTLTGHSYRVNSTSFSSDGQRIASGSLDSTVKIWEVNTGKLIRILPDHSGSVYSVSFSPDGQWIASGSGDNTVKIWEAGTGKLVRTLTGHLNDVYSVSFSPDGQWIASGSGDNTAKIWDASTGKLVRTLTGHLNDIYSLSFSPDAQWIVSGSLDNTVNIWEAGTGRVFRTLTGHSDEVTSVNFSPDGQLIVSASLDNTVKIWEAGTGKPVRTLTGHSSGVYSVSFSPDSQWIISGSWDSSLRFWNVQNGELLAVSYSFDKDDYITYTPKGYYIASRGGEKYASWRIKDEVYTFERYSEQFNRPDIVAEALSGESIPNPIIQLAKDIPPRLQWLNEIKTTNSKQIEIILGYKGSNSLDEITFFHNNKEPMDIKPAKNGNETEIKIPVSLNSYNNSIHVRAFDKNRLKSEWVNIDFIYNQGEKGVGSKLPETIRYPPVLGDYGKKYAIVIGISDYKNLSSNPKTKGELIDLKYTHRDAEAFRDFLENSELSGGSWEIRCFINKNATMKHIDDALTGILTRANSQDLIFIFFSGHGRCHPLREKDVYLLTYDFEPDNHRSGYSYRDLQDLIAESKADHIIAFIDACRSGTIGFGGKGSSKGSFNQDAFGERIKKIPENRVVFSSGRGTELSWEDPSLKFSVFTYYLLKGLRGEAKEVKNPQFVDLGELAEYVQVKVQEHTEKAEQMDKQYPCLWEANGITNYDFPVAIRNLK